MNGDALKTKTAKEALSAFGRQVFHGGDTHLGRLASMCRSICEGYVSGLLVSCERIKFSFCENATLNAISIGGDEKFVGVATAVPEILVVAFSRLLDSPNVFPEIGDISAIASTTQVAPLDSELPMRTGVRIIVCPVRGLLVLDLCKLAIVFLVQHELAHIGRGHCRLSAAGAIATDESMLESRSCGELSQVIELDADFFAAAETAREALAFSKKCGFAQTYVGEPLDLRRQTFNSAETALRLCFFAILVLFELLPRRDNRPLAARCYPTAASRQMTAALAIQENVLRDQDIHIARERAEELFGDAVRNFGLAVNSVTGFRPYVMSDGSDEQEYSIYIFDKWRSYCHIFERSQIGKMKLIQPLADKRRRTRKRR